MKVIAFSPAAEADIGEIWDYSADRWGPDQADSYTDTIRDACYALARGAKQGRPLRAAEPAEIPMRLARGLFSGLPRSLGRYPRAAPTARCRVAPIGQRNSLLP